MRRLNDTAVFGVFEGKEVAVQHTNGTGENTLGTFERQIFNSETTNMKC
jgi:hypothetical protein